MHSVKNNSYCTRAGGGGNEKQSMRKACFPFFKKLPVSARMPRSWIQFLTVSPACSFPNDCDLPPCSALHGCWKPILSHFFYPLKRPFCPALLFTQKYYQQSFLHFSTSLYYQVNQINQVQHPHSQKLWNTCLGVWRVLGQLYHRNKENKYQTKDFK